MKTYENKNKQTQSRAVAENTTQGRGGSDGVLKFIDNRPESLVQRRLAEMIDNSPVIAALNRSTATIRAAQRQAAGKGKEPMQMMSEPAQRTENNTGLPDNLKSGLENLSGMPMDHVRVHYNSSKPAQLNAHAYTQGADIHVGPGQEKHLPHESWHVIQQAQGRVQPTMQMAGVQINDDAGLEAEADKMGAKILQRSVLAGSNREPYGDTAAHQGSHLTDPPTNIGTPPVQGVWRFFDGEKSYQKFVFWSYEGDSEEPNVPVPSAWSGYEVGLAPNPKRYYLAEQRPVRGRIPAFKLSQWTSQYGNPESKKKDVYNPFGRFDSSATTVSFVPSSQMPEERYQQLRDRLTQSDRAFQPYDEERTRHLLDWLLGKNPGHSVLNSQRYPVAIATTSGSILHFVGCTDFGATYSDVRPEHSHAIPSPSRMGDPKTLSWAPGVKAAPEYEVGDEHHHHAKEVESSQINRELLDAWHGKKRDTDQNQVMGMSAGAAAEHAGFDPDEGSGWEWLHLIAHSMGGIDVFGPQVAENLVAGTSECNTQMIIVEEFLKDVVHKTDGRARLHVIASMYDSVRHIGDRIIYDFVIYDKLGEPITVYHWEFDCLSRSNPLVAQNRELRYAGREVFGVSSGKKGEPKGLKGYGFGVPSAYGPGEPVPEPETQISESDMRRVVLAIPESRRSQIAMMLGKDASENDPQQIAALLTEQPRDIVLDIIRGSSVGVPGEQAVVNNVDSELSEFGLSRRPSDSTGFICLIDSIHQLLNSEGLAVPRDDLIQEVHAQTGRNMGDMLEIIGDEGVSVMRAVDNVVFSYHGRHIKLVAHVYMVMPDGTIVPFFGANRYAAFDGDEIDLDLLFVNNNHYEPLFYE